MGLANDLVSQFVKSTNDTNKVSAGATYYGTIVQYNGEKFVKLDGSDFLTPISSTIVMEDGDRVLVTIKDHSAIVTGSTTSPSASNKDVIEIGDKITECEILIADKVSTGEFDAQVGRIDELVSDNIIVKDTLIANKAEIESLKAHDVVIDGNLDATNAEIENLKVKKLDVDIADIKFATIEKLEATNADIQNLNVDYGKFKELTTNKLVANEADIKKLDTEKLSATQADIKYAQIDFANINMAAIEKLFTDSGIIKDLIVSDGHITGELVGVTIKGDLIEGNTIKADKLVVKGSDGLYYKLNVNGETIESQQTDYNSLNGSIITAKSITATKISVDDLVAFDATIAGLNLTNGAIYSGVKSSIDNGTQGFYLDKYGQMSIGDSDNFLKYFKNQNGVWKLAISAGSIILSSSGKDIETSLGDTIVSAVEEFYLSTSPTELLGGNWSNTQPTWVDGTYIWRRTFVKHGNGITEYTPSENGVCITGNTGPKGDQGLQGLQGEKGEQGIPGPAGPQGEQGIQGPAGQAGSNGKTSYFHIKYSTVPNPTSSSQMTETPSTYIGTYVDFTQEDSSDPNKYTWSRFVGAQGAKGDQGIQGINGANGQTSYLHIAYANSADGSVGFSVSDSVGKLYIGQYTDFTKDDSTDYKKYSWTKIKGDAGEAGPQGPKGDQGIQGPAGPAGKGIKSTSITYQASSSGTVAPTGSWSNTIPTVSQGQYLWSKTFITYTDASTSTTYSVSYIPKNGQNGAIGSQGPAGPTGQGVDSIIQQYYLSTSKTTQTGDSWKNNMPTWSTGKYLWTRYQINYKNPSSIAYTSPVCDSSWEAVNEVQVGGRNLAEETNKGTANWTWSMQTGDYTKEEIIEDEIRCCKFSKGTGTAQAGWSYIGYGKIGRPHYRPNTQYTISFDVKSSVSTQFSVKLLKMNGLDPLTDGSSTDFVSPNIWTKLSVVLTTLSTLPESTDQALYISGMSSENGVSYIFRNLKIEQGNKATDWTPAPEDMDDTINDVYADIEKQKAELLVQMDTITTNVEKSYVKQTELDDYKVSVDSQIQQTASDVTMNFSGQISELSDSTSSKFEEFSKYIKFDGENGITIGSGDNSLTLTIDNTKGIVFSKNGVPFGTWDGVDFHTGNIVVDVNERAQFGNFAFIPRSDGSLSFLKVT